MTMTDPIADMLTRPYSVNHAHHNAASMPYSKLKNTIMSMLVEGGYLASISVENACVGKTLALIPRYSLHRESAIRGLQRTSKPGLRVYIKSTNLSKVRGGLGVAIPSTSSDLSTGRRTADRGAGGEVLAYIW